MRIISVACCYFVFFKVRNFDEIGFMGSKSLGLQNRGRFERAFFAFCPVRAQICRAVGARACQVFCQSWGHRQNWPRSCGAEGFRVFFVFFFFRPRFRKRPGGPLHTPLFLFRCFSLLFAFFLGLGATQPCTCVFGQLAFIPCVFWGLFTKTLFFPLKKGLFWFVSQCLPFVLLGFFPSLLSCLYFCFPCFCCFFLSCFFAFVS